AELDMGAPEIIARCRDEGIDMIAITDHNSARNTEALSRASENSDVEVIPGLEVQSSEDIHIVCLMPDDKTARVFEDWIVERLPCIRNIPDKFGTQLVIDENNIITEESDILLVQGIDATADEIVDRARSFGGLSILAHIDRPVYSYVAVALKGRRRCCSKSRPSTSWVLLLKASTGGGSSGLGGRTEPEIFHTSITDEGILCLCAFRILFHSVQ
ncbi:MAG: Putative PHP domain protein, partial [Synergistales bacterium 57_84]